MTSTTSPSAPTASGPPPQVSTPLAVIAFELDYLAAKLTSICEEHGEQLDDELAHELHSAWDSVHVARTALSSAPCAAGAGAGAWPDGVCPVDIDQFTARWDRANEPIGQLISDKPAWAVAEWAAARARYELAFVDAMRPVPADRAARSNRLREAEAELDRACEALPVARKAADIPRSRRRR